MGGINKVWRERKLEGACVRRDSAMVCVRRVAVPGMINIF